MTTATVAMTTSSAPLSADALRNAVLERCGAGARPVAFFARPDSQPGALVLHAVLDHGRTLQLLRGTLPPGATWGGLTGEIPAFHMMERALAEQHHISLAAHPWPKPVRYPGLRQQDANHHPFHPVAGAQLHEVAVGPVHAGVIEPGHFRFTCEGDTVLHLEIQLGYQHRGVEALMLSSPVPRLPMLVETVAGDSSIAHAWAHAMVMEALAGQQVGAEVELSRAAGLELERIAMHLAGLAGMAADVAFLQGATTYGRLRTTAINTTMLLCGSRFGRGWIRPGGVRTGWTRAQRDVVRRNVELLQQDSRLIHRRFQRSRSVQHRLHGTGVVTGTQARELGLLGPAARACGVPLDLRQSHPTAAYAALPIPRVTQGGGDCWARALMRLEEMDASLHWLATVLDETPELRCGLPRLPPLRPNTLAFAMVEGWRGEVFHAVETGPDGQVLACHIQDPSLNNWFGLALAVRGNDISDFPICNKSFDLSYCGHDL